MDASKKIFVATANLLFDFELFIGGRRQLVSDIDVSHNHSVMKNLTVWGQNPVVLAAVDKIYELTGNRGVLVVDRGLDGFVMFKDWLDNKYRFVVRLVGNRHLLCFSDDSEQRQAGQWVPIRADLLAEQTPTGHRFDKLVKRHGKPSIRITQIGWTKVRLPGRDEALTLVVSRLAGKG
jgi:hypothetical protein